MFVRVPKKHFIQLDELAPLDPYAIESQVGNTPLLDLSELAWRSGVSAEVTLYAKAEWVNPSGSIKDRPALHMLRVAEHLGVLHKGVTIADATSGNMGLAYAMLGAARGYRVKLAVPSNTPIEQIRRLHSHGVDLILTDPLGGLDAATLEIQRIVSADPSLLYINQFDNPANWQAHYWATASEIWAQTAGRVTHFVAALGSGGTFVGTARRLKQFNPHIRTLALQPNSPFNGLAGWRHMPTATVPSIYDRQLANDVRSTSTEAAIRMRRRLAHEEEIFVSTSAAGAVASAIAAARDLARGMVVTVLTDNSAK